MLVIALWAASPSESCQRTSASLASLTFFPPNASIAFSSINGRRWTLRILWELRDGALTSRALRTACDEASPTVLQARLSELREAGFIELLPAKGYGLTPSGKELEETFLPLHRFAERWKQRATN